MKRPSRYLLAVLLAAAGALLLFAPLLVSQQGYSRARWIAEGPRRGVRFSGGIMPGTRTADPAQRLSRDSHPSHPPQPSQPGVPPRGRGGAPPAPPDTRVT